MPPAEPPAPQPAVGDPAKIWSQSASAWALGRVAAPVHAGLVTVEFEVSGSSERHRKHVELASRQLLLLQLPGGSPEAAASEASSDGEEEDKEEEKEDVMERLCITEPALHFGGGGEDGSLGGVGCLADDFSERDPNFCAAQDSPPWAELHLLHLRHVAGRKPPCQEKEKRINGQGPLPRPDVPLGEPRVLQAAGRKPHWQGKEERINDAGPIGCKRDQSSWHRVVQDAPRGEPRMLRVAGRMPPWQGKEKRINNKGPIPSRESFGEPRMWQATGRKSPCRIHGKGPIPCPDVPLREPRMLQAAGCKPPCQGRERQINGNDPIPFTDVPLGEPRMWQAAVRKPHCQGKEERINRGGRDGLQEKQINGGDQDGLRYRKLGQGGFGTAWLLLDADGPIHVVKRIEYAQGWGLHNCEHEAKVLESLKHPNIVRYLDSWGADHCFCIVMEYCTAGDLCKYIYQTAKQMIQEPLVVRWFTELCLAVAFVHSHWLMHRDIKPGNIMLHKAPHGLVSVKLGDFGLAKRLPQHQALNDPAGTYVYRSPEVLKCQPYKFPADLWALGCVLYELCMQEMAFNGRDRHEILNQINSLSLRIPRDYSKELRCLLPKIFQRNPHTRATAEELLKTQPLVQELRNMTRSDWSTSWS